MKTEYEIWKKETKESIRSLLNGIFLLMAMPIIVSVIVMYLNANYLIIIGIQCLTLILLRIAVRDLYKKEDITNGNI